MFNHNILERDIERLGKEIREKQSLPEYKELSEKEILKQTIQPLIKRPSVQQASLTAQPAKPAEETILPDYLKDSPAEIKLQVEKLVDTVFHRGVEKTIKEAKQLGPFILDAFHDALTDKLYDELKKRNLI